MSRSPIAAFAALLVLCAQAPHGTPQYLPVPLTAAQLFELNRRATGSAPPGAYHIEMQVRSSTGEAWTAESYRQGRDYWTRLRRNGFAWSHGSFQGRQWRQDVNGLVASAADPFEDVDPFALAMGAPQDPAGEVRLLGLTTEATPSIVAELTPTAGLVERRFYDPRTYLLTRIEFIYSDGSTQVWEYQDYRNAFGVEVAHAVDYQPEGEVPIEQARLVAYDRMPDGVNLAIPTSRALFDLGGADAVTIPADFTANGIFVMIKIGGRGLDFLLDSGSAGLVINTSVARELAMASSGPPPRGFGADFIVSNVRAPAASIGGLTAQNVTFATANFEEQLFMRRVVGLLGTDFIATGALEVDFKKKTVTLFRSPPRDLAANGWSVLPLRFDYGVPAFQAAFHGRSGHFIADLGADSSILFPSYFDGLHIPMPPDGPQRDEMSMLDNQLFDVKHVTVDRFALGDWLFGSASVVVPSAPFPRETDYAGWIGRNTLSNFNLVFDYRDRLLWFKPIDV